MLLSGKLFIGDRQGTRKKLRDKDLALNVRVNFLVRFALKPFQGAAKRIRKSLVSVKCLSAILGPEMGAPIFGSEQKRPGANRPSKKGPLEVIFSPRSYRENAHSKSANFEGRRSGGHLLGRPLLFTSEILGTPGKKRPFCRKPPCP